MEKELLGKPWEQVHDGMRVKLLERDGELFVLAQSRDRRRKENAMRRCKLKALVKGLNHLRCQMIPKKPRRKLMLIICSAELRCCGKRRGALPRLWPSASRRSPKK